MRPLSLLLCLMLGTGLVPRPARNAAPARLRIVPAGQVDLGELGPLEVKLQRYTLFNLSAAAIVLRVFDLAPGTTVAGPALDRPIPGRTGAELVMRVDPAGWVGAQQRNVRLGTDDPGQGRYYLPTRMVVRPDLTVDGDRRTFGDVGFHESPQCLFAFVRETGEPLRLRVAAPVPAYLELELQGQGARTLLACTLRPERVPPGMRLGLERVQVATNAPLQPRFDLYIDWKLHHAIEALPARVVFLTAREKRFALTLKSRKGTPFQVLKAELDGDGFLVDGLGGLPGPEQTLIIRRLATTPARAMLTLRCSSEVEPLLVPLAYLPAEPGPDENAMVVPSKTKN